MDTEVPPTSFIHILNPSQPVTSPSIALHSEQVSASSDRFERHVRNAILALGDTPSATGGYGATEKHLQDAMRSVGDSRAAKISSVLNRHTAGWHLTKQESAELRNKLNDLLEHRPLVRDPIETRFLNILVVGESGLGKTTFLQTFFDIEEVRHEVIRESTTEVVSPIGRELRRQTESGAPFQIRLFDTAGWGDDLSVESKISDIIGCILKNNEDYDSDRRAGKIDTRYHCCFYFIAPHRCKGVDVEFMRRLSRHIIVVPIIAKADAMTIEETVRFKEIIDAQLVNIRTYPFDPRPLPDGSAPHKAYAIIGSDGVVAELPCSNPGCQGGRQVGRGRRYNWGTAFVRNQLHSDFVRLETEVFANYGQLLDAANEYYNRWLEDRTKLKLERWTNQASRWIERNCLGLLFLMVIVIIALVLSGWMRWALLGVTGAFVLLWVAFAMQLHKRCHTRPASNGFQRLAAEGSEDPGVEAV